VLKLVFNFKIKTIPKCFNQYYQPVSQTHKYSTRFASNNNLATIKYNITSSQRSIRYTGSKMWNEMPDKIKTSYHIIYTIFLNQLKKYLKGHSI